MTLIVDTGPIVTLLDSRQSRRQAVSDALLAEPGRCIIPAPVTAEIDYFLGRRLGGFARRPFLEDLAAGRFVVPHLEPEDYATIARLDARYADLNLGLADCSLVVLAHRYETTRILTFDERHFRAVTTLDGRPFQLLPADGPAQG